MTYLSFVNKTLLQYEITLNKLVVFIFSFLSLQLLSFCELRFSEKKAITIILEFPLALHVYTLSSTTVHEKCADFSGRLMETEGTSKMLFISETCSSSMVTVSSVDESVDKVFGILYLCYFRHPIALGRV